MNAEDVQANCEHDTISNLDTNDWECDNCELAFAPKTASDQEGYRRGLEDAALSQCKFCRGEYLDGFVAEVTFVRRTAGLTYWHFPPEDAKYKTPVVCYAPDIWALMEASE